MTTLLTIAIVVSTVITSIVNVAKPAFKKLTGKYTITVCTLLGFALWILSAFSLEPYYFAWCNAWLLIMLWLAFWTGSTIFYDLREIVKGIWTRLNEVKKSLEE